MKKLNIKNRCKQIRLRLGKALPALANSDWLQKHIANCPRCQARIAGLGKVHLVLSLLKSQPHSIDLLMNANSKAINVLKHGLRNSPKAAKLSNAYPHPSWLQRCAVYTQPLLNLAACIMIILLLKIGVFGSMETVQKESRGVVKQYYVKHLGQDYADEIFSYTT